MNMQELKNLIYQGEKVDMSAKKQKKAYQNLRMSHILHLPIQKVDISYLE